MLEDQKQPIIYKTLEERKPETEYRNLMSNIYENGEDEEAFWQGGGVKTLNSQIMRFDMSNGFPFTTIRNLKSAFYYALAELIAFLNGVHTLDKYVEFGGNPKWWEASVTAEKCKPFGIEPGDFGKGSYGPSLTDRLKEGQAFNQIPMWLQQQRDFPGGRTHILTTWYPEYDLGTKEHPSKVATAPCHGTVVKTTINQKTKELNLQHVQRAADVPVGLPFNIVQYAALGMMTAHLLGLTFKKYDFIILDAHLYEIQYKAVLELLQR